MFKVILRGGSETEPDNGIVEVIVPNKPNEALEVYVNRPDGTLDRVYRFARENLLAIKEIE